MALAVRAASQNSASTGTAITVTAPTGTTTGDFVVCIVHGNGQETLADNNGATPFTEATNFSDYKPNTTNGHVISVFYRTIQAGDPGSYAFTLSTSGRWGIVAIAYSGTAVTFDVAPNTTNAANEDDTDDGTISAPTITVANNTIHTVFCGWDTAVIGSITTPTGYTIAENANGGGEPTHASYKAFATGGATGAVECVNSEFGSMIASSFSVKEGGSFSPSASPSASPSVSPSVSPSASPSISPSVSPSQSPSASISPSRSPSQSPSASISPSRSPSASPSVSPSASPSASLSLSPSASPSESPSVSPSVSPSLSGSVSLSASPSVSPSGSQSLSPSISPSPPPAEDYTKGDEATLPTGTTDLENAYTAQEVLDVETSNGVWVCQSATDEYAIHQFKNYVGTSQNITFTWEGKTTISPATSNVVLQIYNVSTLSWETLDSDSSSSIGSNFTLTATVANMNDYVSGGVVTCRVYQLA